MKRCFAILFIALTACNNPQLDKSDAASATFDLPAYFAGQVKQLDARKPRVLKSVWINGKQETKSIQISDWKKELSIFTDADINKRAWAGEFNKLVTDSSEQYVTTNEKIPVKEVTIYRRDGRITSVSIIISNRNYLYTSTDTLSYVPEKLYQIKKMQQIRFMKTKSYKILGKL